MDGKAKLVRVGWMAVALLPLLAGIAGANAQNRPYTNLPNQQDDQFATPSEQTKESHFTLKKANELIGAKVINQNDERLGTIDEIVLTPDHNAISYLVLSHGGVLGFGGKLFAVPWSEFHMGTAKNTLVLNVNKANLDRAPGFDKNHWPATASADWLGVSRGEVSMDMDEDAAVAPGYREPVVTEPRADRYESPEMSRSRTDVGMDTGVGYADSRYSDIKYRRLSELIGVTVQNTQDEDLGELEDAMIDIHQGKLAYGIVSMRSGFLGLNKDLAPVPWSVLDIASHPGVAILDVSKDVLEAIAFDEDNFPNLEDRQYSLQLHERFNAKPYWEALGFIPGEDREGRAAPPARMGRGADARSSGTPAAGYKYDVPFNPNEVKTIHGTIVSVGTFRLEGTSVPGLRLRIRSDEGKLLTVHAGPRPFIEQKNIVFHSGDEVTIMGAPAKAGWRDVIVATQIKVGDQTLELRDRAGKPLWKGDQYKGFDGLAKDKDMTGLHEHEHEYEYADEL